MQSIHNNADHIHCHPIIRTIIGGYNDIVQRHWAIESDGETSDKDVSASDFLDKYSFFLNLFFIIDYNIVQF